MSVNENKEVFQKEGMNKIANLLSELWVEAENEVLFKQFCERLMSSGLGNEIYKKAVKLAKPKINDPKSIDSYLVHNYELILLSAAGKKLLTLIFNPKPNKNNIFEVVEVHLYKQEA